jgi:hypothetical protein
LYTAADTHVETDFMDIDAVLPPPGEEGFTTSHWGEEQALYSELEQLTHAHAK